MMNVSWSAQEMRLIQKGDLRQLGSDIRDFHLRADDPLALAGAPIMAGAAAIAKIPNAIVGQFSSEEAIPLGEGGLAYTTRDIRSAASNLLATGKNILTLHPLRAVGSAAKTVFDALDVVTVDPLLDIGTGVFGHQNKKTRSRMAEVLAA
jgi:hypothetical protein